MKVLEGRKILVVDDEVGYLEILSEELELEGARVLQARNGCEAMRMVREHTEIDAVVSDVRMPGGDGITFLKQLRGSRSSVPVVMMMTANSDFSEREVYAMGAAGILAKPCDMEMLVAMISDLLVTDCAKAA